MQLDFDTPFHALDGVTILKEGDKDVTLASVACAALLANFPDEQNLSGEEKAKRFALAVKAVNGGKQDVGPPDVATLMTLIGKAYGPLVVGRAYELLDPKPVHAVAEPVVVRPLPRSRPNPLS